MSPKTFRAISEKLFQDCLELQAQGHSEYAGGEDVFGNFNRLAQGLHLTREKVFAVYAAKHWDGILSWVDGHRSQREPVQGRIKDLIVYLCLLHAMAEVEEEEPRDGQRRH